MFIEKKEIHGYYSLREQFLKDLKKMKEKLYKRYSGYPSGLKQRPLEEVLKTKPTEPLRHAIKGMLPKGPLGRDTFKKLKVYAGSQHSHQAQNPKVLE